MCVYVCGTRVCVCVPVRVRAGVHECAGAQWKMNPVQTVKRHICKGSSQLAAARTLRPDS